MKDRARESREEFRERCYHCFRPISFCFCESIPRIDNRTDVLILQHVAERLHPFNTARIVNTALRRCHLIVDHNRRFSTRDLPLRANTGLLYPSADAPQLTELPASERPSQLVIIDGTWHQAKTIVRDVPQLQNLPRYRLAPSSPGQYRIRREPNDHSLSTLEAIVAALRTLEPDTIGFDQLLNAFNVMIEAQLGHPTSHAVWRKRKKRESRPRYLPQALLDNPSGLVVAYGEATPGRLGQRNGPPLPVNWVAQRIGTAERFCCQLQQSRPLSLSSLEHMRLSATSFEHAVSEREFRQQWDRFLRPNDTLVVYHQRTHQLLVQVAASRTRCLVLKSIFGIWRDGIRSLEELIAIEGLTLPTPFTGSRADERLAMAVALVEHLRNRNLG